MSIVRAPVPGNMSALMERLLRLVIALSNHACHSASCMTRWLSVGDMTCRDVSMDGMTVVPLFEHSVYDARTGEHTLTLSHTSTAPPRVVHTQSHKKTKPHRILEAVVVARGVGLWPPVECVDVTEHLNARLASFSIPSDGNGRPCAEDYIRLALRDRTLGRCSWDAPVFRRLARHQRSNPSVFVRCMILRVTTMDLLELEFKETDVIRV